MHDRSGLLMNTVVAVLGAFLAGCLFGTIVHIGATNQAITVPILLEAL